MEKKKRPATPRKERTGHHDPEGPQHSKPTRQQRKIQEAINKFLATEPVAFWKGESLENLLKRFIAHLNMNELELVITSDIASVPYCYLVFHSKLP